MLSAPSVQDSDSELSPSDSGEDDDEDGLEEEKKEDKENLKTPKKGSSAALYKTPAKKSKSEALNQPSMVEEYFEAHGNSKVLTSDRTLERLHTPKLDRVSDKQPVLPCIQQAAVFPCFKAASSSLFCLQEMLGQLLGEKPSCCAKEIQQLYSKHRKHFSKWMLQLQLSVVSLFNVF